MNQKLPTVRTCRQGSRPRRTTRFGEVCARARARDEGSPEPTVVHLASEASVSPRAGLLARAMDAVIVAPDLLRCRLRGQDPEAGMTTAEYAVGTIAACALAAVLYRVVTSSTVAAALTGVVHRALELAN